MIEQHGHATRDAASVLTHGADLAGFVLFRFLIPGIMDAYVFAAHEKPEAEKGVIPVEDDAERRALHRQALTATTFVEIVDTLVDDFDVIEVLTLLTSRSVELLDAAAAGILLADSEGQLRVIGASTERVGLLELFQIQNDEGPCLDCYNTGVVVRSSSLDEISPWPRFAQEGVNAGFLSVCAVPLRLKNLVLGCLNLFMSQAIGLSDAELSLAQALADVASIAIVQDQATRQAAIREGHLQHALTSRISIEQAKGVISERGHVDMDEAFSRLRAYARSNNRGLTEVAEAVVAGTLSVEAVGERRRQLPPPPPATKRV